MMGRFSKYKIGFWERELQDIESNIKLAKDGGILSSLYALMFFCKNTDKWLKRLYDDKHRFEQLIIEEKQKVAHESMQYMLRAVVK